MDYEDFKKMNDEMFAHYNLKVKSLKTGKENPRYCVMISGYRPVRIKSLYSASTSVAFGISNGSTLPEIPVEIRKIAVGFIRRGDNFKNMRGPMGNNIYGVEGLSGTEWVAHRSIRLTTEQWADLVGQWNTNKKIEFLLKLCEE